MKTKPCNNCPFRSDRPFPLGEQRAKEIVEALFEDGGFHCHKTIDYSSGKPVVTEQSKLCAGSAIFLEKTRHGGMVSNLAYRLVMLFRGARPEHLSKEVPVYESVESFVDGLDGNGQVTTQLHAETVVDVDAK